MQNAYRAFIIKKSRPPKRRKKPQSSSAALLEYYRAAMRVIVARNETGLSPYAAPPRHVRCPLGGLPARPVQQEAALHVGRQPIGEVGPPLHGVAGALAREHRPVKV